MGSDDRRTVGDVLTGRIPPPEGANTLGGGHLAFIPSPQTPITNLVDAAK
jgi:hypothetical protein